MTGPNDTPDELDERARGAEASDAADDARDADAAAEDDAPKLDPTSRWLLSVALSLVVVLLVTGLSVVMFVFSLRNAPRTAVEHDIAMNQAAVRQSPSSAAAWQKLAYSYAAAKRYQQALSTAEQGRTTTGDQSLLLTTADIERFSGDYEAALAAYDRAFTAITAAQSAASQQLRNKGIYVPITDDTLARVYYGRALSRHALGDLDGAIADLRQAVAITADQANLWVLLGDYDAEKGDWEGSASAYRQAVKFVPDMPEALAGLARLKEGGHL